MMAYVELVDADKALKVGLPAVINITLVKELEGTYKTSITDVDNARKILFLSIPSFKGRFIPIPKGVRMNVNVFDRSSVYEFDTVSLGVIKIENMYVIPVPYPAEVRKTERRRFVRVPLFLDGKFYLSLEPDAQFFPFRTKNVSAGGMLMATKKYLKVGDVIYVDITFEENLALSKQKSKIVREDPMVNDEYVYGVQFLDLPSQLETRLVRFVFQKELKLKNVAR